MLLFLLGLIGLYLLGSLPGPEFAQAQIRLANPVELFSQGKNVRVFHYPAFLQFWFYLFLDAIKIAGFFALTYLNDGWYLLAAIAGLCFPFWSITQPRNTSAYGLAFLIAFNPVWGVLASLCTTPLWIVRRQFLPWLVLALVGATGLFAWVTNADIFWVIGCLMLMGSSLISGFIR